MKKTLSLLALAVATTATAHQPYIAPLAYVTDNSQIPVVASFAEDAFQPEYAIKDAKHFQVLNPKQERSEIETSILKSVTVANLELKEQGTYTISTTASYPFKYVYHQKQWKHLYDIPADKAKPLAERDYAIPSDFQKTPEVVETKNHWLVQSFVTKGETSDPAVIVENPIQVKLSTHPNQLKANQDLYLTVTKNDKPINQAVVEIKAKGQKHDEQIKLATDAKGEVKVTFPKAGEYVIAVSEMFNAKQKQKPTDQYYTIISLQVGE